MFRPCIVIQRDIPEHYVWCIARDNESTSGFTSSPTLAECLYSAAISLPATEPTVDIRYLGLNMGCFQKIDIATCSSGLAGHIVGLHQALAQMYGTEKTTLLSNENTLPRLPVTNAKNTGRRYCSTHRGEVAADAGTMIEIDQNTVWVCFRCQERRKLVFPTFHPR